MPIHMIQGVRVRTDPTGACVGNNQWCAVDDDTYDGPECLIGFGATEEDAIDDLLRLIDESAVGEPEEYDQQAARWDHQRDMRKHSW